LGTDRFRREMDCISGESKITIRHPTGKVETISIEDLKASLSSTT
jgi:hypothetical protein